MHHSKTDNLRILLFLPLVVLHLQFGITLLHHHHVNSWYDHKDSTHHISANTPTPTKQVVPPSAPTSPPYSPVVSTTVIGIAAPNRLILGHIRPTPSVVTAYQPTASFPNRASPA